MVRTIIMTRICCVRVWFMGRHIYSYSLGNFPRINISYLVNYMITGSVNKRALPLRPSPHGTTNMATTQDCKDAKGDS